MNELEKINKKLGLKTFVITSSDQSKKLDYKKEIKIFDRFFTPAEKLDLAKSFRPKYGPKGIKNKI